MLTEARASSERHLSRAPSLWSVTRRSDVRQGIRASKRNRFLWTTTNLVWLFRWLAMSRRRTTRPWSSPASALAIAAFSSAPQLLHPGHGRGGVEEALRAGAGKALEELGALHESLRVGVDPFQPRQRDLRDAEETVLDRPDLLAHDVELRRAEQAVGLVDARRRPSSRAAGSRSRTRPSRRRRPPGGTTGTRRRSARPDGRRRTCARRDGCRPLPLPGTRRAGRSPPVPRSPRGSGGSPGAARRPR